MSLVLNLLLYSVNGFRKMCNIRSDMSVATCYHLCQDSIVVGNNQCQTIQFP